MTRQHFHKIGSRAGLALAGILVGLLLSEYLIRVIPSPFLTHTERWKYIRSRHILQDEFCEADPDPLIGYHNIPGKKGFFQNKEFDVHVRFNRLGFRGPELSLPLQGRRMLFLGDSFTVGWGVEEEQTFVSQVHALRPTWTTVNLGVSGYGTKSEFGVLKKWGPLLHPEDVWVMFYNNDPGECVGETIFDHDIYKPSEPLRRFSYVRRLLSNLYRRDWLTPDAPEEVLIVPGDWEACRSYFEKMESWCLSHQALLHVAYIPDKDELPIQQPTGYRLILETFCHHRHIDFLDLTPIIQHSDNPQAAYFHLDDHCSALGHQLIAQAIVKHLS